MTPGKRPPSAMPRKNRTMKKPVRLEMTPWRVVTTPQMTVMVGSQNLGEVRLRIMLQGTSKRMYPTKKSVNPVRYWFPAGEVLVGNEQRGGRTVLKEWARKGPEGRSVAGEERAARKQLEEKKRRGKSWRRSG